MQSEGVQKLSGAVFCTRGTGEKLTADIVSRQTKFFVYSKNRIFPKKPVFPKTLYPKIYGTLLIKSMENWYYTMRNANPEECRN